MQQVNLLITAVLVVVVIISIILGIRNSAKSNLILDYSEDGDLVENLDK